MCTRLVVSNMNCLLVHCLGITSLVAVVMRRKPS